MIESFKFTISKILELKDKVKSNFALKRKKLVVKEARGQQINNQRIQIYVKSLRYYMVFEL